MDIITAFSHILEVIITFLFLEDIFERKKKISNIIFSVLILYTIEFCFFIFLNSTVVNIIVFFTINYLIAFFFYDSTIISSTFSSLYLTTIMVVSEFFIMNILAIGNEGNINIYNSNKTMYLLMVITSKILYLTINKAVVYVGVYFKKGSQTPVFLLLYPLTTIAILYIFWIIAKTYELSKSINVAISVVSIGIILSVFFTYTFHGKTSKRIDELFNMQKENDRIKADIAYYEILDHQNETLKTVIHDEKNHLLAIKALANNLDVSNYIDKISNEIEHLSMFGNTQNRFLDLLLNKYSAICETNSINFDFSIKTSNLDFIDAPDLITLLSNIIDNSIDAVKQSQHKNIYLSINRINNFDILTCINSCDKKPKVLGKTLQTTKTIEGFHGYGMKSIKKIASKYNGETEWTYNEQLKEFIFKIVFIKQ